jgi:ACS family glucarate transporter-like MFS transporter
MNNRPTWVRWRILGILMVASSVSYILRYNLSLAPQVMMADLGLDTIQWGWIMAAFPIGYAIFQFPGGMLGDHFGPRKTLSLLMVAWGVLTIATAMVPGSDMAPVGVVMGVLISIRVLVGVFHAPIFPIISGCIQRWFPAGQWAFPNGLSSTALTWGAAAAAPVTTWLVVQFGWRTSFLILAPTAFVAAALWWWYGRNHPEEHPATNAAEVALIRGEAADSEDVESRKLPWQQFVRNRDMLLLTLSYSCMGFVFYIIFTWSLLYLTDARNFSVEDAAWVTASQWVLGGFGALVGGWLADRLAVRWGLRWGYRWPVVIGMVMSGLLLLGALWSSDVQLAIIMFVACFFFNQLVEGPYWGASIAIGGRYAASAGGLMNTGNNGVGAVNAVTVGWIAYHWGFPAALSLGAVFAFVGAGLMLLVRADQPIRAETGPPSP